MDVFQYVSDGVQLLLPVPQHLCSLLHLSSLSHTTDLSLYMKLTSFEYQLIVGLEAIPLLVLDKKDSFPLKYRTRLQAFA